MSKRRLYTGSKIDIPEENIPHLFSLPMFHIVDLSLIFHCLKRYEENSKFRVKAFRREVNNEGPQT